MTPALQSFPNADGMRAQLESHVESLNSSPDVSDPNPGAHITPLITGSFF